MNGLYSCKQLTPTPTWILLLVPALSRDSYLMWNQAQGVYSDGRNLPTSNMQILLYTSVEM